MNPLDMQIAFQRRVTEAGRMMPVYSEDVFYYLNLAQDELVRSRYAARNRTGSGFEESQEVIDDLEKILKQDVVRNTVFKADFDFEVKGRMFHADKAPLPEDRLRMISYRAYCFYNRPEITWTVSNDKRIADEPNEPKITSIGIVQSDDLYRLLTDPYNTPIVTSPIAIHSEEHLVVYTNKQFIVDKIGMSYIKKPQRIVRGKQTSEDRACELPEILHQEVVQMAVRMYITSNTTENT